VLHLRWATRVGPGDACRIVTVSCERGELLEYHDHDFPEVFWLEEGSCRHVVNGRQETLHEGHTVLIRPRDAHALSAFGRRRFRITNVELSPSLCSSLAQAFPEELGAPFGPARRDPATWEVAHPGELRQLALALADGPATPFRVTAFLLDLFRRLMPQPAPSFPEGTPAWLQIACQQTREPEVFRAGVPELVRLAGRSHEHVGRACRRHLGKTPSNIVNRHRVEYAARELRLSSRSVTEIALDCGFSTPAPFYRLFARAFAMSPREYRKRQQDFRGPIGSGHRQPG
jgi:AraC family transcriptional regulator, dual regulator of chb operon